MQATIFCKCQSRMEIEGKIARCLNSACKEFGKEFHAPDLDLQEIVPVVTVSEAAEPSPVVAAEEIESAKS